MKIGIDLGGTKTEGILIDSSGSELTRKRINTEKNYQGTMDGIVSLIKEFENDFGDVESIGVGMPGCVSNDSSLVKNANSVWLNGKPLKVSRQKKLKGAFIAVADWYCFKQEKHIALFNNLNKEAGIVRTYPDAFGHLMAIRGTVDVMVDPLAKIWDYAPCKILAQEAGGRFANFSGNQASIEEGTAIVGNENMVKEVRKIISQ